MSSIKPINNQAHQKTRVKNDNTFVLAKGQHLIPLFFAEYEAAGSEFPIVFVKDHETGQVRSAAMMGLKPSENLIYSDSGWRAGYVPFTLRVFPFVASPLADDKERMMVCIDEDSALVSSEEGELLFAENGEETEYLKERGQFAVQAMEHSRLTEDFIKMLVSLNLIKSNNLDIKISEQETYELSGLYSIDRERLQNLSDEEFLSLRKAGYLPAIFAALASMNRVSTLLRMKAG